MKRERGTGTEKDRGKIREMGRILKNESGVSKVRRSKVRGNSWKVRENEGVREKDRRWWSEAKWMLLTLSDDGATQGILKWTNQWQWEVPKATMLAAWLAGRRGKRMCTEGKIYVCVYRGRFIYTRLQNPCPNWSPSSLKAVNMYARNIKSVVLRKTALLHTFGGINKNALPFPRAWNEQIWPEKAWYSNLEHIYT